MHPPPFLRWNVFIPQWPYPNTDFLSLSLGIPIWLKIKPTCWFTPVNFGQASFDHFKVYVYTIEDNTEGTAMIAPELSTIHSFRFGVSRLRMGRRLFIWSGPLFGVFFRSACGPPSATGLVVTGTAVLWPAGSHRFSGATVFVAQIAPRSRFLLPIGPLRAPHPK